PADFPSDVTRPERPLAGLRDFFRDVRRIFADAEARGSLLAMALFQGVVLAGAGAVFMLALDSEAAGHADALGALTLVCVGTAAGCGLAALQSHPYRSLGLVAFGVTGLLAADVWVAGSNVGGVAPALPSLLLGLMGGVV